MKKLLLLLLMVTISTTGILAQTTLEGKISDAASGEPILFGTVALYKNDVLVTGTETDLDGNYFFSDMDPGNYDLEVSYVGYQTQRLAGISINAGRTNRVDMQLSEGTVMDIDVVIKAYKAPLIEIDNTTTGATVSAEKIRSLPLKSVDAIAATSAGIASTDDGLAIRGSRPNATVYYIDGIRVSGSNNLIPQSEIEQLQVITGGVEAKYGDLVGGAISITSKGPSQKFGGTVEAETSEGLDGYGYNLLTAALSGPILKNNEGESILGYRFSGQYRKIADSAPRFNGLHQLSQEQINQYSEQPTYTLGGTQYSSIEQLRSDDIPNANKVRENEENQSLNLTGKIDARLSKAIDISLSGSYSDIKNRFAPTDAWAFANWNNNPFEYREGFRANFRFRHKLGQQGLADPTATEEEKAARNSNFRNLYYVLQAGYEKRHELREDLRHEDNFFNYGYYGNQPRTWEPVAGVVLDPETHEGDMDTIVVGQGTAIVSHLGYAEISDSDAFVAGTINSVLAKYNDVNGFRDPNRANAWGLYNGLGRVYDLYRKRENDIITFNLTSGFDFLPGGSKSGRHSIQIGFLYEQRINRQYELNPEELWNLGNIEVNAHITGLDYNSPIGTQVLNIFGTENEFTIYDNQISTSALNGDPDQRFIRQIRELTESGITEYVNLDGIDPSRLTLNMFSPQELLDYQSVFDNSSILDYYGYDHLGNKLSGTETFDDFFNATLDNGARSFVSPAFKPIYGAAYVQDKFSFRDIIFRVGVRMDYYDANTKVLKDPYSLYDIKRADDFFGEIGDAKPEGVPNDAKVYVTGTGSTTPVGFRQGDQWYDAAGTASSGSEVFGGGGLVFPALVDEGSDIKKLGYDVNNSFEDYEAQVNFMPRLAFSFPISEEAGFFAHYDVLYQRPPSNSIVSPMTYYYWERAAGNLVNNPNLKPVRTIDYEVGFQKKLTASSALKVSAFYKEMKDLIQRRVYTFLPSPITQYETFSNLDFGTVKGFQFQYDRRRVGPIELIATYSLQFADGSGSDANSSQGLNQRGPIRNLIPLSYDERHRLTAVIDYRYFKGEGPEIAGAKPFQNAGVNFNLAAISGRPYSRSAIVDEFGGSGFQGAINGARLPWTLNVDMRVDKSFKIKTSADSNSALSVNVYLRVQNLFNSQNVTNVFSFTGDAESDGYLISSFGQDRVRSIGEQGRDAISYQDVYAWRLNAIDNFSAPRRIYFGVILDF